MTFNNFLAAVDHLKARSSAVVGTTFSVYAGSESGTWESVTGRMVGVEPAALLMNGKVVGGYMRKLLEADDLA